MVAFVSDTPEELPAAKRSRATPERNKTKSQLPCLLRDASLSEEKAKLGEPAARDVWRAARK
jgi:hypothetical protein